jgi:DNA-binding NtrC family response regulator
MNASGQTTLAGSVLVVDDDAAFVAALVELLQDEGFSVIGTGRVDEALECIEHDRFDVVLSDVEMPGKSGFDLITALAADHIALPVVLMTGSARAAHASHQSPAAGCLLKPFDTSALVEHLQAAIST